MIDKVVADFGKSFLIFSKFIGYQDKKKKNQYEFKPIHEEWIKWLLGSWKGTTFRQLLAHRGSYKSTAMVVGICRFLLFKPNYRIGLVRANKTESAGMLKQIKNIINDEKYIYILRELGIIGANQKPLRIETADSFTLTHSLGNHKEGNIDAIGYEQSVTGRHYDILLFDDFVTIEDRLSPIIRKKKYQYANEFIHNILVKGGLVINLGTFWHSEDSNQRFKEVYGAGDDTMDFKQKIYPLGSVFGETKQEIENIKKTKIKSMGQSLYSANYELIYKEDEDLPFGKMNECIFMADRSRVIATIDTGYGGNGTAMSIGNKNGEQIHIVGKLFSKSVYDIIDDIVDLLKVYGISKCYIEGNADKGATTLLIKQRLDKDMVATELEDYSSTTNKAYRIMANLKPRWDNVYFDMEKSDTDYLIEVREWNSTASRDDAPDSLAKLLEVISIKRGVAPPSAWSDI